MTLPSPISSTVFVDNELTNEAKWYARIFTPINAIIAWAAAQLATESGAATPTILSGTNAITGTVTFPTAYAAAPAIVVPVPATSGGYGALITAMTATNFTYRVFRTDGTNAPSNTAVTFNWISFG